MSTRFTKNDCVENLPKLNASPVMERILVLRIPCASYDKVAAEVKQRAAEGKTPLLLSHIDELGLRDALADELLKTEE